MKHCQQEMTVIQNAWPVVCNFGWLIEADRNARKGKRYRAEVLNFTARLEDNLFSNANGNIGGRSAFRLLNANLGRWFCAARGLWPTGYSRKCRLKGACFRSRLDRAVKNLYCRGGGNATHGLERSLDETLSAGNDGDSKRLAGGVQFWLAD